MSTTDEWVAYKDVSGATYYYNSKTGVSQWKKPAALLPIDPYDPKPIFSREYLQNYNTIQKEKTRQKYIQNVLNISQQDVLQAAASGKTSYCWETDKYIHYLQKNRIAYEPVTDEELIEAFEKKYPECKVSHGELWVEQQPGVYVTQTGLVISWH